MYCRTCAQFAGAARLVSSVCRKKAELKTLLTPELGWVHFHPLDTHAESISRLRLLVSVQKRLYRYNYAIPTLYATTFLEVIAGPGYRLMAIVIWVKLLVKRPVRLGESRSVHSPLKVQFITARWYL